LGWVSAIDSNGRTIWIAHAHRGNGKRFVVRADEKLTAFMDSNRRLALAAILIDTQARFFQSFTVGENGSDQVEAPLPRQVLRLFRTRNQLNQHSGEKRKERRTMNPSIQLKKPIPLFLVALACLALSPRLRAVDPPPDGGYPGQNTAEGEDALFSLTTGVNNTAIGFHALYNNVMGSQNTATGAQTLLSNTFGSNNAAFGFQALYDNTRGSGNTAVGCQALESNTTGSRNTATGIGALEENTAGNLNTANGFNALYYSTGSNNIGLGANGGVYLTTGSHNIDIGNSGIPSDTGKIRIGTQGVQTGTFIAGIYGVAVTGSSVVVNSGGKLGVSTSSVRFKEQIKPMEKASEAILALKPVTFHYKEELDPNRVPQFGLVAEEVAAVNPDLVARDAKGEVYTVRHEAINAMLLNEFLKAHRKVEAQQRRIENQEATITQLKRDFGATIAQLTAQLKEQAAQIQKVSGQLELSKPAPQMVANKQ
jgi:hypothetical protein